MNASEKGNHHSTPQKKCEREREPLEKNANSKGYHFEENDT